MIYLDHAATVYPKPKEVADAVYHAMINYGSGGRGGHSISLQASRLIYETREKIATMFGIGNSSRVIFTASATESLNIVIQGLLEKGECCVTSCMEHNSVLRPVYEMERRGVEVRFIAVGREGKLDEEILRQYLAEKPKMLVLNHASNVTGIINDLAYIGTLCKEKGILFVVDASQTAGIIPINMKELGISALCFSAHKGMLGPQGVGVLCLAEEVSPRPLKFGGTGMDSFSKDMSLFLPMQLEPGTLNTQGIVGLSAACDYIRERGQEAIYQKAMALTQLFKEEVKTIPGIKIYSDLDGINQMPIVALNLRDLDASEIEEELSNRFEIAVRGGAHCAPLMHESLGTIGQGIVRFSFSHLNTEEEVREAIVALKIIEEETR